MIAAASNPTDHRTQLLITKSLLGNDQAAVQPAHIRLPQDARLLAPVAAVIGSAHLCLLV
jgi:hypothetical protein